MATGSEGAGRSVAGVPRSPATGLGTATPPTPTRDRPAPTPRWQPARHSAAGPRWRLGGGIPAGHGRTEQGENGLELGDVDVLPDARPAGREGGEGAGHAHQRVTEGDRRQQRWTIGLAGEVGEP